MEHLLSPTAGRPSHASVMQFATIDGSKITGITFFLTWANHYASPRPAGPQFFMHAHTPKEPSARSTFDKLLYPQDWAGVWNYVPFPHNDRLICFGIEHESDTNLKVLVRNYASISVLLFVLTCCSFDLRKPAMLWLASSMTDIPIAPRRCGRQTPNCSLFAVYHSQAVSSH